MVFWYGPVQSDKRLDRAVQSDKRLDRAVQSDKRLDRAVQSFQQSPKKATVRTRPDRGQSKIDLPDRL